MLTLDVINQFFTWRIVFCILFLFFSNCCLLGVLNWWWNWWLRTVHVLFIFTRHTFLHLKNCMMKAFVWSFALYRSETWTLQKEDIRRLEAFEIGGVWWKYHRLSTKQMKRCCRSIHKYLFLRNVKSDICNIHQYNQNLSDAIRYSSVLITTPLKGKEKPKTIINNKTRNQYALPPRGNAIPAGPLSDSDEILCR